jgi:hypothetical protein
MAHKWQTHVRVQTTSAHLSVTHGLISIAGIALLTNRHVEMCTLHVRGTTAQREKQCVLDSTIPRPATTIHQYPHTPDGAQAILTGALQCNMDVAPTSTGVLGQIR